MIQVEEFDRLEGWGQQEPYEQETVTIEDFLEELNRLAAQAHAASLIPTVPKRKVILKWSDFQGNIPENPIYHAWASWYVTYNYSVEIKSKSAKIKRITVEAKFNHKKAWARIGKVTDELLKHEQGHMDIAYVSALEFKKRALQKTFTSDRYQQELEALYRNVMKEYSDLQKKYDEDTCHFNDKEEQANWNLIIDHMILDRYQYW